MIQKCKTCGEECEQILPLHRDRIGFYFQLVKNLNPENWEAAADLENDMLPRDLCRDEWSVVCGRSLSHAAEESIRRILADTEMRGGVYYVALTDQIDRQPWNVTVHQVALEYRTVINNFEWSDPVDVYCGSQKDSKDGAR